MPEVRGEWPDCFELIETKVTQTTTRNNRGLQRIISECITCQTLKQMGTRSRKPMPVPHLLANQNLTIEDWKNIAWSDESEFKLLTLEVRIWCRYPALYQQFRLMVVQ